jgi:fructokinase
VVCDGARVEVVDTVGAGDSFMSALIAGLHGRGLVGAAGREGLEVLGADTVHDLLGEAVAASAITCSRLGADPPRAAELAAWQRG